jgi:hypothetical protein
LYHPWKARLSPAVADIIWNSPSTDGNHRSWALKQHIDQDKCISENWWEVTKNDMMDIIVITQL